MSDNLILSRGEIYFDPFFPGTLTGEGEMYLGNTPGFTVKRSVEQTERLTSYGGRLVKRPGVITQESYSATLEVDAISTENLAMWLGGSAQITTRAAAETAVTETFAVKRGRWYQLGATIELDGVQYIDGTTLVFRKNGVVLPKEGNVQSVSVDGRFMVLANALDINDGDVLTVDMTYRATDVERVLEKQTEVVGALRFLSRSAHGADINFYFPCVSLTPRNPLDLKADDWVTLEFDADIRKKNPSAQFYYSTRVGSTSYTADEAAIILSGLSLDDFPFFENIMDEAVNLSWNFTFAADFVDGAANETLPNGDFEEGALSVMRAFRGESFAFGG